MTGASEVSPSTSSDCPLSVSVTNTRQGRTTRLTHLATKRATPNKKKNKKWGSKKEINHQLVRLFSGHPWQTKLLQKKKKSEKKIPEEQLG